MSVRRRRSTTVGIIRSSLVITVDETQYGTKVVVDETMVTGDFRSTVSQEDANNKAKRLRAVEAQGQDGLT